jgi:DNA-binding MarR family transcriptional regulator
MRRLILELAENEISQVGIAIPPFQKIKSLELLHFLRQDSEEFAAIWRVELKTPSLNAKDLPLAGLVSEVQILEQEKSGAYTVFVRGGPILSSLLSSFGVTEGYLFPPIAIRGGKIKICFLGSSRQISDFLEKLKGRGIHYRVVLLAEANFGPDSPLNQLTKKQKEVLTTAYRLGYYDIPRRINSDQLAEKLKIANSTLVEHLRKAERRLIVQVLTRGTDFWFDDSPAEKVP